MHIPVLREEVLEALRVQPGGVYIDATAGAGGHSEAMGLGSEPGGKLLALDRDPEAVERVYRRLSSLSIEVVTEHGNFSDLGDITRRAGWDDVGGILFDLGMSSLQLDDPVRGFSFQRTGPLDMRMNTEQAETAAEWLQRIDGEQLESALRTFGEEPSARRIAEVIVEQRDHRPITTTEELAELVRRVKGRRRGRIDPATRTFQAVRMAVNDELAALDRGLAAAIQCIRPGGRIAVISFHSVEDRVVKRHFRAHEQRWESLPQGGQRRVNRQPVLRRVVRRPVVPNPEEIAANPRARSAKLRVVERVEETG